MPGSKFYCTMIPRKGNRKDATRNVNEVVRGNSDSRSEMESGYAYVCGVSGVQNARRRVGKRELLYMQSVFGRFFSNPRHPGDPVAGTLGSDDQRENRERGNGTSR